MDDNKKIILAIERGHLDIFLTPPLPEDGNTALYDVTLDNIIRGSWTIAFCKKLFKYN